MNGSGRGEAAVFKSRGRRAASWTNVRVCVCARLGDGNRHADTLWDDGCDIGLRRRHRASMEEGAGWEEFHANTTATFVGCQQHSQQFLEDISNRWVNSVF